MSPDASGRPSSSAPAANASPGPSTRPGTSPPTTRSCTPRAAGTPPEAGTPAPSAGCTSAAPTASPSACPSGSPAASGSTTATASRPARSRRAPAASTSSARISSSALPNFCITWNRSRTWTAWPSFSAITLRYGFHMSLHTYCTPWQAGSPRLSRHERRLASVRSSATANSRFVCAADVVHERQIRVPAGPGDLVHAQGRHPAQVPMRQAPLDRVLHRPADAVPRRAEDRADLAPAQPLGPGRQDTSGRSSSAGSCRRTTAPSRRSPRTACSPPAASGRPGRPGSPRSARTRTAVPPGGRTPGRGVRNPEQNGRPFFRGLHLDHQRRAVVALLQAGLAVDERLELLHPIEDRLDTHPGALPVPMKRGNSILAEGCPRMRSFLSRRIPLPLMHPQIGRGGGKEELD